TAVDIDVAATVDHDFIPALVRRAPEISIGDEGSIRLPSHETVLASRDDQQRAVGKPVEAKRKSEGRLDHAFALAVAIDRHDRLSAPVREPETIVVPSRRFTHRNS